MRRMAQLFANRR